MISDIIFYNKIINRVNSHMCDMGDFFINRLYTQNLDFASEYKSGYRYDKCHIINMTNVTCNIFILAV